MEKGIYRKVNIGPEYSDDSLEPTQLDSLYQDDKVRIMRYYGMVPREYLEQLENTGLAQEARKQSLLASKQQNQDDDLWEVNSDLEKWSS